MQRSRRYSEGCPCRGACRRASRSTRRNRSSRQSACGTRGRRDEHLRRWHDQHFHREGNLQRPWWRSESYRRQTGYRRSDGPGSDGPGSGAGSRQNRARDSRGGPGYGSGASGPSQAGIDRRQHGSHRRFGQVQGRDLFKIDTPQRDLLESRRSRHLAERSRAITIIAQAYGGQSIARRLLAQQRLERGPDVVEQNGLPERVRMNLVALHQLRRQGDVIEQEGHQR
jgi:hypothetical protein